MIQIIQLLQLRKLGVCALFIAGTNIRVPCVFRSLKIGRTFSYIKLFAIKIAEMSFVW